MANKDVLKISFDAEAGIKELERDLLGSMDQISDEVADKLEKAFEKAGRNPKLKKQLTGVYQGLFDELTGASGNLDKVNAAIDRFAGKIEYINTVTRKSKVPGIFDNLSIKDVDKVLKGYDSVIEKEEELAKLSSNEYKNDIRTKTTVKSLKALENAYKTTGEEKTKYEKKVTDYIKNSGVETSAISKEIKQYSSLITLFEKINNAKVDYGSEDAIKKSQALLFVMQKIVDLEGGNKLFSNFRTNELKDIEKITSSIFELTQNGVEGSITSFVSKMMKPIKDEITSLYEGVVKDLLKMSKHQAIADAKTQAKVSNAINSSSGNKSKKTGNGVDTGDSDNSPDFVEKPDGIDVWTKSAQELEEEFKDVIKYATDAGTALAEFNRLGKEIENKQHTRGSQGWKDFMGYGQKLLSLDKEALDDNDYSDFFWNKETEYEQFLDRIDQMTQKQLEKIEKLKTEKKDIVSDDKIGGSGDIDDSKVEELQKEISEVKEDITALKGRVDTLEDTTAFDNLSSQVAGFDEKIKSVDGSIENLVNSFKLLSELSLTDLQKVSIPFFNGINQVYKENNGNKISGYWDKLKEEIEGSNVELRELLKLVGLYNSEKDNVKLVSSGMVKSGGLVGDTHTLLATKNKNNRFEETQLLKQKLDEAYTAGVNVSRILDIIGTKESDVFLEIQETASGNILGDTYNENPWVNPDIYKATDEQIKKLMSDLVTLNKLGIGVDTNLTNIFYDKEKGFSFIDLDLKPVNFKDYDEMFSEFINTTVGEAEAHYEDIDDKGNLEIAQKLRERFEKLSEQVQQAYAEAQDSHSPSKEFEKLENDAVDGIVAGANNNEDRLKNVGRQMADNVKDGFKEGMAEVGATAPSDKNGILSGDDATPAIEGQQKLQKELKETRTQAHLLTDEYGQLIYANRGVSHTIGAGLNSNRYHGGTFWSKSQELASHYGEKIEVANLSMDNPFEIDNKGNNWDEIELYYNQLNELQNYIEKIKYKVEDIQIELSSLDKNEDGFQLPSFDVDDDGNILSFGKNSINIVNSLEQFRDFFFGFVDLDDPKIQQSITNLYEYLQSYSRMNQLINKTELNTNEVVEIAKTLGYDGVIFKNIVDGSDEITDIFVTLNKNQVHYVETLDNMTVQENLAKAKAEKVLNARKELFNIIKNITDSDLNNIVSDFQMGAIPNIWSEFFSTQDFNDDFNTIKTNLLKYINQLKSELETLEISQQVNQTHLSSSSNVDSNTIDIGTTGMTHEAEQAEILKQKIVDVTTAVDTKTRAFQEEEQVVIGTVQREISNLELLEGQIWSIINEIKRLDDIKVQINIDGSQIDDSFITLLDNIRTKTDDLPVDTLSNLANALSGLKVTVKTAENLELVAVALSEFKESINGISAEGNDFLRLIGDITSRSSELKDLAEVLKSTTKKIKEASEATKKVEDKSEDTDKDTSAGKKNKNYDAKKNKAAIEETSAAMEKLKHLSNSDIFSDAFAEASTKIEEANTALKTGDKLLTEYKKEVKEIQAELQKKAGVVKFVDPGDLENARTVIEAYAREISEYQAKIKSDSPTDKGRKQNITYEWIEKETGMVRTLTLTYDKLTGAIYESSKAHKQAEKSGFKFSEMLKQGWMNVVRYVSSFVGFYEVINWIRNGVTVIRELDTALTEMRKVSDESVQSLKNFQKISFDIGNSIGATAAQIQNSAADFMRLGYSLQEASELAEDANIYANVGDMEIDEATEHMISSIKAWESEFESEVEASEAIIDRYNEIGNNFAISSADIGSAMERSSAALKAGGNTLNESLGLITAGNIIQQDAETTAAALKILSLRIRGSKAELEEMGESTDGLASSTSKLREEIKGLTGIDIMADENTYKSTAQIIQEIGEVWENLTDVSQAATLEKLAGELNCLKFVETHFYRTHLIARIA